MRPIIPNTTHGNEHPNRVLGRSCGESSEDLDDLRVFTAYHPNLRGFPPSSRKGGQGGW
jgi:hypothetical protein